MGDEDGGSQLPQRERGASRPGPNPPGRPRPSGGPGLPDDLRERIQAAVAAERANAARETVQSADSPEHGDQPVAIGHTRAAVSGNETKKRRGRKDAGEPVITKTRFIADVPAARAPATVGRPPAAIVPRPEPPPVQAHPGAPPGTQPADQPGKTSSRRFRLVALAALALAAVAGVLAARAVMRPASSAGTASAPSPALLRQEAATRNQAASWVAQQVSPAVTVACDPVMCATLAAHGFPAGSLLTLGPTSPPPTKSAVVVATAAVRGMFGSSLSTALAPAVLASFGSGPAGITVRVIAPDGAAAYQAALGADQAIRKTNGSALLNNPRITLSGTARTQLAAGQVDSRLLLAVASLATAEPINVVQFGNLGPGADPGLPLRFADLATSDQAAHMATAAYVKSVRAALDKLNAQLRPARTVMLPGGQAVLRVEFTAPSPLGLFGG